jgi:hypothetical protein
VPNSKYEVQFTINSEDTVKASFDSVYNTYTIPVIALKYKEMQNFVIVPQEKAKAIFGSVAAHFV